MATTNPIPENTLTEVNTTADLLVFVTAMAPEQFKGVLANLESAFSPDSFVVATQNELPADVSSSLRIVATPQSNAAWSLKPVDFVNAAQCGREHEAKAFLILGPESDSLSPLALRNLADAVLERPHRPGCPALFASLACRSDQLSDSVPAYARGLCIARSISFVHRCRFVVQDGGAACRRGRTISAANQADALLVAGQ